MARRWWVGLVAAGLLATGLVVPTLMAKQGVVHTRDGQAFEGDITEAADKLVIKNKGGETNIDRRNIANVVYSDSRLEDEYAGRHAKLTASDVKGRIDLATWALQSGRADLANQALTEARKIDPANRDAALLQDTVQHQIEMDQRAATASGGGGTPATTQAVASTAPAASQPSTSQAKLELRLLNADEINIIRQSQLPTTDTPVAIRFDNQVEKKYLASGGRDVAAYRQKTAMQRALEIIQNEPSLAKDVRVMTDPSTMVRFHNKVLPMLLSGCATSGCHGGATGSNASSRDFFLYNANSTPTAYTDFYILQHYSKRIGAADYLALDPTYPDSSLILQYSLPVSAAMVPHPKANGYRPRFQSKNDPGYREVVQWLTDSIGTYAPTYQFDVAIKRPSTQPAGAK